MVLFSFQIKKIPTMAMHHYFTKSLVPHAADSKITDIYDGEELMIPPESYLLLVPCFNPDHTEVDIRSCLLLTRDAVKEALKTPIHVVFVIDNTSTEPLHLQSGAVLGSFFDSPHDHIKAEKAFMLTAHLQDYGSDEFYPEFSPPSLPTPPLSPHSTTTTTDVSDPQK
jgi:hypothetical protein